MPRQKNSNRPPPRSSAGRGTRRLARGMFYTHLWAGLAATGVLLIIAVTGILLNHKRTLSLMPSVSHQPQGGLSVARPLGELADEARAALGPETEGAEIDRMDVRPSDGIVKVRFDDPGVTEVTLDLHSGEVLDVGERNDVFLQRLHSGEVFGDSWILLSDAAAVLVLLLLGTGIWLWLYPKSRI